MSVSLQAGAAALEITPRDSQFLFGYPHVERMSTGVHDPLFTSALYLRNGERQILFSANDIIFVPRESAVRIRERIERDTGVPADHVLVSATHTHSGPLTVDYLSNEADPVVPKTDRAYVAFMEDQIVAAAVAAVINARPAEAGLATADGTGVGTNRRDPAGPADPEVPVLCVREAGQGAPLALMPVYCMHPTVLHEDSTLISADFPGMTRQYLQESVLSSETPVLYHSGPAGNQSPRHVTRGNTFDEARRLGKMLGRAVEAVMPRITYRSDLTVSAARTFVDPPTRSFPPVADAEEKLRKARERFEHLKAHGDPKEARTAECDWFGAEETLTLARANEDGRLVEARDRCVPAEVQVLRVGPWTYVGWPPEIFVEYDLALKKQAPGAYVVSMANGEMQGYIVTPEAAEEGGYEASNAFFAPETGDLLVRAALDLIGELDGQSD